jgi:hypothetical protein
MNIGWLYLAATILPIINVIYILTRKPSREDDQ